jgi:leader peptidase (prepilin peptidase) / N-methyltransferase
MIAILLGVAAGLLIGSFLNVCIHRLPRDLSVVRPRSYCPACEHPIAAYDNIPLLSYLLLGGRCRHCSAKIPVRYPTVELLTATLFTVTLWRMGIGLPALKWCVFEAIMVGLLFCDLEERILPDEFTLGGAVLGLLLAMVVPLEWGYAHLFLASRMDEPWTSLVEAAAGAVVASGMLWMVGWAYSAVRRREGLGLGDVKMMAAVGAFLGLHGALYTLVLGSLAGSIGGLIYIRVTKKDFSTYELPMGTFLGAAAILIALLAGPLAS